MVSSMTNTAFQVSEVTERFQRAYPTIFIIKATATKVAQGIPQDLTVVNRGEHGVHSMRGVIIITHDTLFCYTSPRFERIHAAISQVDPLKEFDAIIIPYEAITQAFLLEIHFGSVLSLQVDTGNCYQFGLNRDRELPPSFPFQFESIKTNVGWTKYRIQARMRCLGYLIALGVLIALIITLS